MPRPTPAADTDLALFGRDDTPRLIDVRPLTSGDEAAVRRYLRSGDGERVVSDVQPFYPFFFLSDLALLGGFPRSGYLYQRLAGSNPYQHLIVTQSWGAYWDAIRHVERAAESREKRPRELYLVSSPVQQYLTQTGQTCFKGMAFDDLHRLQLDIETYTTEGFPNANRPGDGVIIVALSDNRGWKKLVHAKDQSEEAVLRETLALVRERDPDVIEMHNGYAFDLPYLRTRCQRYGIPFALGRDGSEPRTFPSSMRFAERSIEYEAAEIDGRHIVDTYFQVMSFDVFKRDLPGYGLKAAARYFGFAPEGREYVAGGDIPRVWDEDPDRLLRYALDDVIETERLARHLSGSTFYLTQMLPMPYGQVARTGPASKIEALFVREYLRRRHSLPSSQWGSQTLGGYTDVFVTGVVGPVVYADVESLYPSIMLGYDVKPASDEIDLFPALLRRLTDLRFETKAAMKQADDATTKSEYDARQTSYKNLINCFDPETEIMTVSGPKPVADVQVGEQVYALDPATGQAEIKPVTATYAQDYDGPMVRMKTRFVDFLVTPEHRFLTQRFTGGVHTSLSWETAGEIAADRTRRRLPSLVPLPASAPRSERYDLPEACDALGLDYKTGPRGMKEPRKQARWHPRSFALSDWLAFLGWFASEGTLSRSTPRRYANGNVRGETFRVTLCQKRAGRRAEIEALLGRMGFAFTSDVNGFHVCSKLVYLLLEHECGRYSAERRLPGWVFGCAPGQLRHLFGALMAGDGDAHGGRYTTKSEQLAQDVCRLALHLGLRAYVMQHDGLCYRVAVNHTRGISPTLKADQRRTERYSGPIHCLTVADHHTVLAGRNGRFNWTGQSFYGSLGFGHAAFNDFAEADRVASVGQDILRDLMRAIRKAGGLVVEVDTDGVLFVPPSAIRGEDAERAFVSELSGALPEGIRVGFDGRFAKMLSYKKKNYALLGYDGTLKFKGSSLVSRSVERFGRRFVREGVRLLLGEDVQGLHDLYLAYRERIKAHDWSAWDDGVSGFSRTETLKNSVAEYERAVQEGKRPRAASYELAKRRAHVGGPPVRVGDRISYYLAGEGTSAAAFEQARFAEDWDASAPDENTAYYLRRLDEFARKFATFFEEHDFRLVFSEEDLFGFSPENIRLKRTERSPEQPDDEVPF
jgi:DNA polymerase elongation subunit (family B)